MIIAVNTRLQKNQQPEGYEDFMFGMLSNLAEKYPGHRFIYIFDRPYSNTLHFAKNVQPIVAGPQTSNSLRLQYWFNFKIPKILRQHKADVFLSLEGICSLRIKKPQCLFVSDLVFLQQPQLQKKWLAAFYKKFTPFFLAKAKAIAAVSGIVKSVIVKHYKIEPDNIAVIHPSPGENFKPMSWDEKDTIREKYTDGKAYFLFSGNIDQRSNYINLLKAFSFFKKRQRSNMLLVFAGNANKQFLKDLKTYKLRNELKLLENLSGAENAAIIAAAYGMVYPVLYADIGMPVLQAMQCQVPVIVSNTGSLASLCGDAALYCNANDFENIAENMMLVFKDEDKAKEMIEAGLKQFQGHSRDNAAELLMQSIQTAYNS